MSRQWTRITLTAASMLAALLLGACKPSPVVETPGGEQAGSPTTPEDSTPGATETPAPFKEELVVCTVGTPDAGYGPPWSSGAALAALTQAAPTVLTPDYVAHPGPLLAALPSEAEGTLRRNEDGTVTATLVYNMGLTWSDGTPFSLDDAVLGLSASSYSTPAAQVIDVQRVGEDRLKVTLAEGAAYPYVPPQPPLPSHVVAGEDPTQGPVPGYPALGPYTLVDIQGGDYLYTANVNYPQSARIGRVRVRFFTDASQMFAEVGSGGCDATFDDGLGASDLPVLRDAQNAGQLRLYTSPGPVIETLILNTYTGQFGRTPLFADSRVRQAVTLSINRAALIDTQGGGVSTLMDSWLPVTHWAHAAGTLWSPDVTAANNLLDQAGWRDGNGDGVREYHGPESGEYSCQRGPWAVAEDTALRPVLIIPANDSARANEAEQIKTDLAQIGIAVQVQPVDAGAYFSQTGPLQRREFDMALLASIAQPDPAGINRWVGQDVYRHPLDLSVVYRWQLEDRWLTTEQLVETLAYNNTPRPENNFAGQNYSGWCDEAANVAIVEAALRLDPAARQPYYAQQQAAVSGDVPELPLFQRPRVFVARDYLCGHALSPYAPLTWNVAVWYFDETGACTG